MADSTAQRLNFCKKCLKKYTGEPKSMRVAPETFLRHDLQCDPDSLKRAAQFFELDYTDPDDFTVLVNVLAEIVFGPRPRGRKTGDKIWDRQKFFSLGLKYNELKSLNPQYRDTKIAELGSKLINSSALTMRS
jgi:hypothetical protein